MNSGFHSPWFDPNSLNQGKRRIEKARLVAKASPPQSSARPLRIMTALETKEEKAAARHSRNDGAAATDIAQQPFTTRLAIFAKHPCKWKVNNEECHLRTAINVQCTAGGLSVKASWLMRAACITKKISATQQENRLNGVGRAGSESVKLERSKASRLTGMHLLYSEP